MTLISRAPRPRLGLDPNTDDDTPASGGEL
jgi:hypothetical protein